jgi:hypothetical protein
MARHYSFDTKLAILETIRANGAKDEAGYWVYADGWNDARVAKETDSAPQVVSSIRQAHCGEMKKGGFKQGHKDNIFSRLTLAEEKIDHLIGEIDALKRRPVAEDQTRLVDIAKLPHVAPLFVKTNGA